jgi:hypothetical protein
MFIRWKTKPRDPQWGYDEYHCWRSGVTHKSTLYIAYLVESIRIDGNPRQKTIYLASIKDTSMAYPSHRLHFWKRVQAKIELLHLSGEQLISIKNALLKRVPDVTREQLKAQDEEMARQMAELTAHLKKLR